MRYSPSWTRPPPAAPPRSEDSVRISRTTGLPLDWTASQCAAYRGVSRQQWLDDVQEGLEPADIGGSKLWDAAQVRSWKRPDEWTAGECAAHHGITTSQWTACVRQGAAPGPVRKVQGRSVWRQTDVKETRLNIPPKPTRTPRVPGTYTGPDPNAEGWTAAQCADYLGISTSAWRAAVRRGEAPQPVFSSGSSMYWNPDEVKAVRL